MLKEAINRVLELAAPQAINILGIDGSYSSQTLRRVLPPEHHKPDALLVHTLTGLSDYLKTMTPPEQVALHVVGYNEVRIIGGMQPKNDNARFLYAYAELDLKGFEFNRFMELETFIIALQSLFVPTPAVEQILNHLGNLASEQVRENKDDGFSQSIQVRVGIRMKSEVKIENPITLQPWRTFREIEQPASNCILRLKEIGSSLQCALFVADGGRWQLEAIERIKEWLKGNADHKIPIIA